MKRLVIPLLILSMLGSRPAAAQDDSPLLTLKEAVDIALKINPSIRKMEALIEGKAVEWKTATGLSDPEISYAREGISAIDPMPFSEQRFAIQQEFDFPLTTFYRLKRILNEKQAREKELEALRREVTVKVKSYYAEIISANYYRKLRADVYKLTQELVGAVRLRVESGVGTYIDQLSSELRLTQAENEQYEAERVFHEARYRLFNYMGLNPDEQRYDINFQDTLRTHNELIEQEVALYTLESQPLYQSAKALVTASGFGIREARSGYLPDIRVGYLAQDFGTGYHFRGLETGLRIPLWGLLTVDGEVKQAQSIQKQNLWEQKSIELTIKEKIELAWHGYDNSQVTIHLYQTQLRDKSEKLLELTREAYRLGQIDLLKLIEAQQLFLTSQEKYYDALRNYYLRLIELEQFVNQELVY